MNDNLKKTSYFMGVYVGGVAWNCDGVGSSILGDCCGFRNLTGMMDCARPLRICHEPTGRNRSFLPVIGGSTEHAPSRWAQV